MKPFTIYTTNNAKPASSQLLNGIQALLGFVPNVFAVIAESYPALAAFVELNTQFSDSSFNATSREIIQIATSMENQCNYCVAGHTAFAEAQNISKDVVDAIRNNQPIYDKKLEALNRFTRMLVRNNGMISDQELRDFIDAGYTPEQVLEVILGICVKTFSNLAGNAIGIPLDDEFTQYTWSAEKSKIPQLNQPGEHHV